MLKIRDMHDRDAIEAEAERIAPYPKTEPSHAGMYGLFITAAALTVFCALAGIEFDDGQNPRAWLAFLAVAACGYAGPFLYFNSQKRRHFTVWGRLDTQARERDAQGS
jgi:predicted small lipoprotein YifL